MRKQCIHVQSDLHVTDENDLPKHFFLGKVFLSGYGSQKYTAGTSLRHRNKFQNLKIEIEVIISVKMRARLLSEHVTFKGGIFHLESRVPCFVAKSSGKQPANKT